jgi:hypothetical protein
VLGRVTLYRHRNHNEAAILGGAPFIVLGTS